MVVHSTRYDSAVKIGTALSSAQLGKLCQRVNELIAQGITSHWQADRSVGLLGGDHSIIFGSVQAHQSVFPNIGVLQIDAHADLRPSLDGLTWSHASVMHCIMETLPSIQLTQVSTHAICSHELILLARTAADLIEQVLVIIMQDIGR